MSALKIRSSLQNQNLLNVEALEDRVMLSSVEIFAAGATGQENLDVLIDGQVVQTFFSVVGDASTRDFQRFSFSTDQTITPGNIGIRFANDAFDPSIGLDRDLIVDRIVVDGVTVEAEDPSTFSTGIFANGGLTGPGFFETEVLNINGTLTFADPSAGGGSTGSGDLIEFDAFGTTGEELVNLVVDGEVVQSFILFQSETTHTFESDDPNVSLEDIRIEFVNDLFDASLGIDRNVQINEFRVVDGGTGGVQSARTSDANVLNSGVFIDGAVTDQLGAGGFLVSNGFVEISGGGGGGSPGAGDQIEFDAVGSTGEELVNLIVNGQVVQTFGLFQSETTHSFQSNDPSVSLEDIRLEFVNDLFDASTGLDRNAQIFEFRVIDGDTGAVQSASTFDSNVLSSGIFTGGQITQGFGAGGFLAGDFNGNAFVEISDGAGSTDGGPTSLVADPSFQETESAFVSEIAIGPGGLIAAETPFNGILVVDSNGVPLSSFGDNGRVDIDDLLNTSQIIEDLGFGPSNVNVTDIEFFDDGSLLVTGAIRPNAFNGPNGVPLIAKLNPDGTLDGSFSQQGVLQGTLLQLPGGTSFPAEPVFSAIDPQGRIITFGLNVDPAINNYVVSRLNPDGTIDSTFGDNGNVFLEGSSFAFAGSPFTSGDPIGLDVSDNGEITFAFSYLGIDFSAPTPGSFPVVVASRLSVDGSIDRGFSDNGFFVSPVVTEDILDIPVFELTPDDGVVIAHSTGANSVSLLLLNPDGELFADVVLTPNPELITDGLGFPLPVNPFAVAVDQSGNIIVQSDTSFSSSVGPMDTLLQRVLPSGEIDTAFGLDGGVVLDASFGDILFDSQNRLVRGSADLQRFEFV